MPEVMSLGLLNAQRRVQLGLVSLSDPLLCPVGTLALRNYRDYFSFTRGQRASCERWTEESVKRTLRGVSWYRAWGASAVLTRAEFSSAKARATRFPHGP